jgi:2,3-diketo-5-methylthiopentyl-1-phosphate enolase
MRELELIDHPSEPASGVRAFFEALARIEAGDLFDPANLPEGALKQAILEWG